MPIVHTHNSEVHVWYVVFDRKRVKRRYWWDMFVRGCFGHCYVLKAVGDKHVIKLEKTVWGIHTNIIPAGIDFVLEEWCKHDTLGIVSVVTDYRKFDEFDVKTRLWYDCVSFVKDIVGLKRASCVFTPWQLYKYVVKSGGIVVKPYIPLLSEGNRNGE